MRITIPDELADLLQALAPKKQVEDIAITQLKRFLSISPREHILVIRDAERKKLEDVFQVPELKNAQDILDAVQKQHRMTFAGVDIDYSPAQLREIERRARKNRRPMEDEIKDIAKETARLMLQEV